MAKRQLIGAFYGVPDEMLRPIGIIVVSTAQLDAHRMKLLAVTHAVAGTKSARMPHDDLTKAIEEAFDRPA